MHSINPLLLFDVIVFCFVNAIGGGQPIQLKDTDKEESENGYKYESPEHERLAFAFKRVRVWMGCGNGSGCVKCIFSGCTSVFGRMGLSCRNLSCRECFFYGINKLTSTLTHHSVYLPLPGLTGGLQHLLHHMHGVLGDGNFSPHAHLYLRHLRSYVHLHELHFYSVFLTGGRHHLAQVLLSLGICMVGECDVCVIL